MTLACRQDRGERQHAVAAARSCLTRSATGSSVTTFTNDLYGRRTGKITGSASTAYIWDPAGRLTEVASADATATYAYGISGMREQKTVTTASGTTTTKSVWSGGQLAVELDSDGTRYTYLWGPGRIPLSVTARTAAGVTTTYAYHTDALGSVLAMTDAAGSIVATYTYDPWGRVTSATNSEIAARNPLRYRAYYLDAETGLYYMPARYYDPTTARFLSVDPAAPSAGDPSSLNAFAYCLDDPVNATDPSGATVDIDGNGRIDAEDSITEQYIQTPEGSLLKMGRKAGMIAATRAALDPVADAISIAMTARHNRDAAMARPAFVPTCVDWYGDFNVSLGLSGVTFGIITNYTSGWYRLGERTVESRYFYAGASKGTKWPSVSKMTARGRTNPGFYAENSGGAVFGDAIGLGPDGPYLQDGMTTPQVSYSVFYVLGVDLK